MKPPFPILHEDNHLLVVNKPAPLVTQGAREGEDSLIEQAKRYIKRKYDKPGNVYLGIVSRLDSRVTGAIVLARTSKSAARLNDQFRQRTVDKTYWAVVPETLAAEQSEFVDHLRKDESQQRMVICSSHHPNAQEARLRYRQIKHLQKKRVLVEIQLDTGRKHQIRVQFASRDCPIIGDQKYGSPIKFPSGIALHSRRLAFDHPTTKERLEFAAELPPSWTDTFGPINA